MSAPRSIAPTLLRLAGPVALARLGIMGMGVCDVIVVGQVAPAQLPYQALGWAPTGVFLVTAIGLLTGVQVLAARAIGENKPEGAGSALQVGLMLALAAGAVSAAFVWFAGAGIYTFFGIARSLAIPATAVMRVLILSVPLHLAYIAAAYFTEAIQRPLVSTIVMWVANAVNLALNLWLVPLHGAVGAAYATVGSRFFLAAALLIWIWTHPRAVHYGVRSTNREGPGFRALLAVGIAAAVSQAVEAGAFSAMTFIAGRIGAAAVAAYQIMLNIMALIFMIALGFAAASAVLVSEAMGRKDPRDAAHAGWTGIQLNAIAMMVCGALLLFFPHSVARAYSADASLAALIASLMWIAALVLTPDGAQVVTASALRARGDNWFPTFSHILAYAVVMPVLGWYLAERRGLGVAGLLYAILISSILSGAVLVARWTVLNFGKRAAPAVAT